MAKEIIVADTRIVPRGNTSVGYPRAELSVPRGGSSRPMRNVTKAPGKLTGPVGKAARATGRQLARRAVVATAAYDAGRLALSKDARKEAEQKVLNMAEKGNAADRFVTGLLDPVNTGFGIAKLVGDTVRSAVDARRAAENAPSDDEAASMYAEAQRDPARNEAKARKQELLRQRDMSFEEAANARLSAMDMAPTMGLRNPQVGENPPPNARPQANSPKELAGQMIDEQSPMLQKAGLGASSQQKPAAQEKVQPAATALTADRMNAIFQTATGTPFDPKSRLDRQRLAEIQSVLDSQPDLADKSPTKIALAWYRSKK